MNMKADLVRIAFCESTKRFVLQQVYDEGKDILCLHYNEDDEEELKNGKTFRQMELDEIIEFLNEEKRTISFIDVNGLPKTINLSECDVYLNDYELEFHYLDKNYTLNFETNKMFTYFYNSDDEISDKEYIKQNTVIII